MTASSAAENELQTLLAKAYLAEPGERISYRDAIARHGDEAVMALIPWTRDRRLAAFAVRTIEAAARHGSTDFARSALLDLRGNGPNSAIERDVLEALGRLERRPSTTVTRAPLGATIAGTPVSDVANYAPALTASELELIQALTDRLPSDWTLFVRPHLDGDRPSLALLHPTRGAMIWDVRDWDLTGMLRKDATLQFASGSRALDPIARINAVRTRIYQDYLPGWAEAIDARSGLFGIVRAGLYFPSGDHQAFVGLGWANRDEVIIDRSALTRAPVDQLVPNAFKSVDMRADWYRTLYRLFSEYHPPTFGRIVLSRRQRELVEREYPPGWSGIEGVAGSGKSLILARRAARLASLGRRVLLVTYNLTLANYCRGLADDAPDRYAHSNLVIQHFHGLCSVLLRALEVAQPLHPAATDRQTDAPRLDEDVVDERATNHYEVAWPQKTLDAIEKLGLPTHLTFDSILIDEAQDFSRAFFDVLEKVRTPNADVLVAFDRAQRLYVREDGVDGLLDGRRVSRLNGTRRLRRRHAEIATAFGQGKRLPTDRIQVDEEDLTLFEEAQATWISVDGVPEGLAVVATLLERWRSEPAYRPDSTVVLAPNRSIGRAAVALLAESDIDTNHVFPMDPAEGRGRRRKVAFVPHDQRTKVATIHSYKGWEAEYVIILEPPSGGTRASAAFYVALTRPQSRLVVVASADPYGLKQHFDFADIDIEPTRLARVTRLLKDDETKRR